MKLQEPSLRMTSYWKHEVYKIGVCRYCLVFLVFFFLVFFFVVIFFVIIFESFP